MNDTVTRLMALADDYADVAMAKGEEHPAYLQTRQALQDELQKLFTPLSDEQIESGRNATFSTGNPYCPCDSKTMRKAVQWAERQHGIGERNETA